MSRDPTERFTGRVDDYVRWRPHYPDAMLDVIRRETGLTPDWVVADIGSGTGISAEPFLENGNTVFAVEPNAEMRAAAESWLGERPGFRSVDGAAEATTLDGGSIDLVVAAQAFHWFRAEEARTELGRVLRRDGWVALIWNRRRTQGTPFMEAYEALLVEFGTDYQRVRHDRLDGADLEAFFGGPYVREALSNDQRLPLEGLRGRLLSSSYTPAEGDPARASMLQALDALFDEHEVDGEVRMEQETELYIGRLA